MKFSSMENVLTKFVAPQNLWIDTYLIKLLDHQLYENCTDQVQTFGVRFFFWFSLTENFAGDKQNAWVENPA